MTEAAMEGPKTEAKDKSGESPFRSTAEVLIQLRGVGKSYERGGERLKILNALDLDVPVGSFEALMGPSGSGKSTLLNLIAGLDRPTAGTITVSGKRIDSMTEAELARWRA